MAEIKTLDGIMSLDESNDVIGKGHHKYAKNGVFKGNSPEAHFTSIRGNTKVNNSLISYDCRLDGFANRVLNCTPLSANVQASYCDIAGHADWYVCELAGTCRQIFCDPFSGLAYQMYYYYDLVRCDGTPGTSVGRSKRQSAPLGQVYAGGDFATYACRYINSAARGPYYDYNLPGMPVQAPPYDFDLSNPSYIALDPGGCDNCLYCNPTVGAYATGYSSVSAQLACYNRIAPPSAYPTYAEFAAGKKTIYMQCDQKIYGLRDGAVVYNSAPLNNPTGLLAPGWYSWSDPSDYTNTNAKVWYVSAADNIVSILHNEQTCASVGYPALVGTYQYGCATACYTDPANPQYNQYYHGSGYVNVSAISGGTARDYRWTITNPAGTTSSMLTIGQVVTNITNNLANGIYKIRVYDSRGDVYTEYSVTIGCQCCLDLTGQAFVVYYYYTLTKCDGSGTLIGRSIRQSADNVIYYLGGQARQSNCAYVTGATTNTNYTINLDSTPYVSACSNIQYCTGEPKAYSAGYGSTKTSACYNSGSNPGPKITLYIYNNFAGLDNGIQVWTNYDGASMTLSGHPSTSYYYAYGGYVYTVDADGYLSNKESCSGYETPQPSATYSTGCTGYTGTGYITMTGWSGGVGTGYYAKIYLGGTYITELYPASNGGTANLTASNLANGTYTIIVGDYRRSDAVSYTATISCGDAPAPTADSVYVSNCDSLGQGTIKVANIGGGTGNGYYFTIDGISGTYPNNGTVSGLAGSGTIYTVRVYDSRGTVNTPYNIAVNCEPVTYYYVWNITACYTGANLSLKTTTNVGAGNYIKYGPSNRRTCAYIDSFAYTTIDSSGAITPLSATDCSDCIDYT